MTATHKPVTPEAWADFLLAKTLSSPFTVGPSLLKALNGNALSYNDLVQQLEDDPVLSYYIMTHAHAGKAGHGIPNKTPDQAISMIGTETLKTLIRQVPFESSTSTAIHNHHFVRALVSSLLAAYIARSICYYRELPNPDHAFWASLLLGVPLWLMWRFAPADMRFVRHAVYAKFQASERAETDAFGCSFRSIAQAVTERQALPDLVKACYFPGNLPSKRQAILLARAARPELPPQLWEDRKLAIKMQQPAFVVMLANLVASAASYDWYSRATLRSQRILASYLNVPQEEAIALTHEAAAIMSRNHPLPGVMLPAAKLILPPRVRWKLADADINPARTAAEAPSPLAAPPSEKPQPAAGSTLFSQLTDAMIHQPDTFADMPQLMNVAMKALAEGVGLQRATAALISPDGQRLKTFFAKGCDTQATMQKFQTAIPPQSIFAKLCEKPASVWIKHDSARKIQDMVPDNFRQAIAVTDFFLMSVFVGKRPIAILYADAGSSGTLNDRQYQQFKFLCGAVAGALSQQARRAKKGT